MRAPFVLAETHFFMIEPSICLLGRGCVAFRRNAKSLSWEAETNHLTTWITDTIVRPLFRATFHEHLAQCRTNTGLHRCRALYCVRR